MKLLDNKAVQDIQNKVSQRTYKIVFPDRIGFLKPVDIPPAFSVLSYLLEVD